MGGVVSCLEINPISLCLVPQTLISQISMELTSKFKFKVFFYQVSAPELGEGDHFNF